MYLGDRMAGPYTLFFFKHESDELSLCKAGSSAYCIMFLKLITLIDDQTRPAQQNFLS